MENENVLFLDKLETYALDPVDIRRIMLLFLRTHFSDAAHYMNVPELSDITYKSDDKGVLHIAIGDVIGDKKCSENVNRVPAIMVVSKDMVFGQKSISGGFVSRAKDGTRESCNDVTTEMEIQHIANSADMALLLATQTAGSLLGFSQVFLHKMKLSAFDVIAMSAPNLVSNPSEHTNRRYMVSVMCRMKYNFTWSTLLDNKLIKTISFAASREY
jgi:hypothetical protein